MPKNAVTIRTADSGDALAWRPLWDAYNAFYRATVPESVTAETWRRICDPGFPLFARLAVFGNGQVVGFACCVLHWGTWISEPICYLEDLYVDEAARGQGIGALLIQDLIELGRPDGEHADGVHPEGERLAGEHSDWGSLAGGWSRLYWHTEAGNAAARRLYDRFAQADGFVRYRLML